MPPRVVFQGKFQLRPHSVVKDPLLLQTLGEKGINVEELCRQLNLRARLHESDCKTINVTVLQDGSFYFQTHSIDESAPLRESTRV